MTKKKEKKFSVRDWQENHGTEAPDDYEFSVEGWIEERGTEAPDEPDFKVSEALAVV